MFTLFVAVTMLKDFETLDCSIDVFNKNAILGNAPVELLLQVGQLALSWFLKRRQAELMKHANALISFISNE